MDTITLLERMARCHVDGTNFGVHIGCAAERFVLSFTWFDDARNCELRVYGHGDTLSEAVEKLYEQMNMEPPDNSYAQ